ncbi:MAG: hypothetical protein GQ574_10875 [Crocinitomix sp.]|nr:hypothetical protein [Crocinitomix sp.]
MQKLNTQNPDFLTWTHENIQFDILGGIRLEGLDRLRVTVRATYDSIIIRHNVDLYNDNQLTVLVRKCAERFEMSSSFMYPVVGELVNMLEDYRIKEINAQKENSKPKKKELSKDEIKQATGLLKTPNLLDKVNDLIGKSGVIGEENNRLLMYIIFTSRLMSNPLHIISMGASGTGKSHLQETVAELIPEEDTLSITDLSESSFYYFDLNELSHKLILIEDLDGAENALYPLRELQSKKTITKTFVEKTKRGLRTTSRTVNGPVCVGGCTTREKIYEDNSNRSFLIYIDSSADQDEKIMDYQRALSAGDKNEAEQEQSRTLLKNAQRILKPIKVINPFAKLLKLPQSVFKPRRTNAHYLHFIEAVTFLHQAQRTLHVNNDTGEEYIETTLEDIENANYLLKDILLKKSDRLTPACRQFFEGLKSYLQKEKITDFKNMDVRLALGLSHSQQKRYMSQLLNDFYIQIKGGNRKTGFVYEITSFEEYKQLKNQINTVLDKVLKQIKPKAKKQVVRQTA